MRGKLFRSLVVSGILLIIYTYKLGSLFSWDTDWSRDLYDTAKLASGDMTLIGPALTGAVFAGPYYYYSLVPQLRLSGFSENAILYVNATMFGITVGIICYVLGSWAALFIGLMPFWVLAARHPGNAYSYLPLLLILLITIRLDWAKKVRRPLGWGFLAGVAANYHPASVIITLPVGLWKSWQSRNWSWLITFGGTYLPILVFEIKHNFVMTQAILSGKFLALVTSKTSESVQWHYLLPLLLFVIYVGVLYIAHRLPVIVRVGMLIALAMMFPFNSFKLTDTSNPNYKRVVEEIIKSGMIKKNTPFNVLGINDEKKLVVSANEFRYFLLKMKYRPLAQDNFTAATNVIIFSKFEIISMSQVDTWEIKQFATNPKVTDKQITGGYYVYKLAKN